MWRKQNQKMFILLTRNVSMMKIFVSGKCSFHSADGLWKEAETLAQMFLLNNSVTWRHEKYADNIHKTNLHAFGFVEMCTCYITGNMWWFGFFWLFLFLTSTFLRAGENIDIKLSCIRTAKLITSLCCYLLTPETAFIFQKLNKTGIIWLWFSSIWNGRSSGSESELFIHLSKVEACLKAEIVHPVLLSSGEKKQQPTKWSFL